MGACFAGYVRVCVGMHVHVRVCSSRGSSGFSRSPASLTCTSMHIVPFVSVVIIVYGQSVPSKSFCYQSTTHNTVSIFQKVIGISVNPSATLLQNEPHKL